MDLEIRALQFANLLGVARISVQDGKLYERQEELVLIFRERKQAFLAVMPMRHRFKCPLCKGEGGGAALLHFENPAVPGNKQQKTHFWGIPAGLWVQVETGELHNVLAHKAEPGKELLEVLKSVTF
jgi:hypothetical protein